MADERQFEDDIIRWMLTYYKLLDTRTRYQLLDKEEEIFDRLNHNSMRPPTGQPRRLTFRAFNNFFPGFPFALESKVFTAELCRRMTFPKPFVGFGSSPIARAIEKASDFHPAPALFAVVFRWPYQKNVTDAIVAHNKLPPDTRLPGVHCCWRFEDNTAAVLQNLPSFVATVDKMWPDAGWMQSALDPTAVR